MLENGSVIQNTYEVLEEVGSGGAGIVYRAWHRRLQKYVVLKRIKDGLPEDFNRRGEVDILKGLHHRYLPQVYDFITHEGAVFTVIDFIDGMDLAKYMRTGYFFKEEDLLRWLGQLCEVLQYLHTNKPAIIHSDIKPANIMITTEGNVCLIDFNISLDEDQTSKISGFSKRYASPEQIRKSLAFAAGQRHDHIVLDARTDIYSLGATFYYLMTGMEPAPCMEGMIPLSEAGLDYSSGLTGFIEKTLEQKPRKRYASADKMLRALEHMEKQSRAYRKKLMLLYSITVGAGICLIIACTGIAFWKKQETVQAFQVDYMKVTAGSDEVSEEEQIEEALALLNDAAYEKVLKGRPEEKARILYAVGDLYFQLQEYRAAESFYEETIEMCSTYGIRMPEAYRDYAIALSRQGKSRYAERILDAAGLEGDSNITLVKAELAMQQENHEEAIQLFEAAADAAEPMVRERAWYLWSQAYAQMGNQEQRMQILEEMAGASASVANYVWRELGDACFQYASGDIPKSESDAAYARAVTCFEWLYGRGAANYNDKLSLISLYQRRNDPGKAGQLLRMMEEEYTDDYKIYMHLAYVSIQLEEQKSSEKRDYHTANDYYRKAHKLYEKALVNGETDEAMQELEAFIEELYNRGQL